MTELVPYSSEEKGMMKYKISKGDKLIKNEAKKKEVLWGLEARGCNF